MRKVPKLRFKEFSDEWEEKKLGDISKITSGLTPLRSEEKFYLNGVIPWVKTSDLNNSYIKETEEKISEFALKETSIKLLPKNTLLVAMYGGFNQIGRTGLTTIEATTNQALSAIKFRDINKFPLFFQNVLNYKVDYWKKVSASSRKDPNITKKDIEDFKVIYPKLEEQEKIANFLTNIDKKISLIEEKLELFREYKKGVMQKIFSQELRFKDNNGNDYPEWEEKILDEIGEIITGKTPSTKEEKYWNGGIQFVTPTDMKGNKYQFVTQRTVTEKINIELLSKGTIMFTCIGATIGKMSIATNLCITNQQINSIMVNEKINNEYVYYYLLSIVPKIQSTKSTTTMPIINKTEFSKFEIQLPTLEEQQKIADFLSSIDSKIESIEKEFEGLKEFKKGLLQQMFI